MVTHTERYTHRQAVAQAEAEAEAIGWAKLSVAG